MPLLSRSRVTLTLTLLILLSVGAALLSLHPGTPRAASASSTPAAWPQVSGNAQHTCVNPAEHCLGPATVARLRLAWSSTTDSEVNSGAVLANGHVYFTTLAGTLDAMDARTGALTWSSLPHDGEFFGSPAVANGVTYVGASAAIIALDNRTGKRLWSYLT